MIFIILLIITTIAVASAAAFFSIYGLAHLFASAWVPVIIMGTSLEAGKLLAASFLYRYWNKISFVLKTYLASAVIVLMIITSMGIFGYLTSAYQQDSLPLTEIRTNIQSYESELKIISERKKEIDKQIADMPPTYITAKQRLISQFKPELEKIEPRISELTTTIQNLKQQNLSIETKIGPIIFISEVLGRSPNDALFFFVIIIMCVFDPLAIALTVACNIAIKERRNSKQIVNNIELPPSTIANHKTDEPVNIVEDKLEAENTLNIRSEILRKGRLTD